MSAIIIRGGRPLSGSLTVQGAKNSVLPILAATLLSGEVCRIRHCPRLRDVNRMVSYGRTPTILPYSLCSVSLRNRR